MRRLAERKGANGNLRSIFVWSNYYVHNKSCYTSSQHLTGLCHVRDRKFRPNLRRLLPDTASRRKGAYARYIDDTGAR